MEPEPERGGREPAVYARLRHDAEIRLPERTPSPWVRRAGFLIALAILVVVVVAVLRASPW